MDGLKSEGPRRQSWGQCSTRNRELKRSLRDERLKLRECDRFCNSALLVALSSVLLRGPALGRSPGTCYFGKENVISLSSMVI